MVVESEEARAGAAEELALLPKGSAIVVMFGDYAMMREQERLCVFKPMNNSD